MRNRFTYPGHLRAARNTLIAVGVALVSYRLLRAAGQSAADLATSIATVLTIVGATVVGAVERVGAYRARAEAAELKVIHMSDAVLDDEADKALWDSIPAAKIDEDTCAFGLNVVVLNQHRFPRAG